MSRRKVGSVRGVRGRGPVTVLCLGLAPALALVGCTGDGDDDQRAAAVQRVGNAVTVGTQKNGMIIASPQKSSGERVVIDRVQMPKAGYVVVYADGGGAPGQRLGVSELLKQGTVTDLVVPLSVKVADGTRVHAMLHREDSGNTSLDFPGHDAPLSSGGGIVETSFVLTVS